MIEKNILFYPLFGRWIDRFSKIQEVPPFFSETYSLYLDVKNIFLSGSILQFLIFQIIFFLINHIRKIVVASVILLKT